MCGLCNNRTRPAVATGTDEATIMIVGDAPSEADSDAGRPFADEAGALLDRMIAGMGFRPDQVYLTNAVKCPTGGVPVGYDDIEACNSYLEAEIELVRPVLILALGRTAVQALGMPLPERWRGTWVTVKDIPAIATFHPAYVLTREKARKTVGLDLRQVVNAYAKLVG
jgi:DNA polymerase